MVLFLQVTWEVVSQQSIDKDAAVYVGIQQMEYGSLAAPHLHSIGPFSGASRASMMSTLAPQSIPASPLNLLTFALFNGTAATGGSFSVAAGRLSFTYGFKGPAVSIDTACSSALVATHQGMLLLRGGQQAAAPTAVTAGVNLMLSEATTAAAHAAGMLTLDGRCKTLDAGADGYVRGEACTAFLLTAGDDATQPEAAGAVLLRATHVNQDGRSSSLTAPNGPSQQAVIRGALLAAGLLPSDVGALEMHGTGANWALALQSPPDQCMIPSIPPPTLPCTSPCPPCPSRHAAWRPY